MGLASRALDSEEVLPAAVSVAEDMAANCAPVSLALTKRLLWSDSDLGRTVELESAYHRVVLGAPDAREGPQSWVERRIPQWTGSVNESWVQVLASEDEES